jgi:2-haloacid dehalogenase
MLDFSRFQVLTFDCYGTLIDWESGIRQAFKPLLASHGKTLSDDRILELYAELESATEAGPFKPYRQVLEEVVSGLGKRLTFTPTVAEIQSLPLSLHGWQPFPDTVAALRRLKSKYKLAVISNVDDDLFAATARLLQVSFSDVITAQQVGSYKPSRNNFEVALTRLGVPREQVLHVAQSLFHDIAPAKALGLATVWVNRRAGKQGAGATRPASVRPDLEVPDLATLAAMAVPEQSPVSSRQPTTS